MDTTSANSTSAPPRNWAVDDADDALFGLSTRTRQHGMADLDRRYRASGGLLSSEHVLMLMRERMSQPISRLARWLAGRQLVQIAQPTVLWLPAFQFTPCRCQLRPGVSETIEELSTVLDDIELACWFASPNISLGGHAPAEVLLAYPEEVRQVARLDRFVLNPP